MYVEPSTDVYILKNCPLESSYEHTVIFDSKEAQEQYFLSLAKFHPTAGDEHRRATYQRVNLNALKIELPVEKLYDCNYMMFKNEYFENKWFYAFITSVEYVNNRTCLINYYIDVMQTWFFEAQIKECFVEREHVMDDRIGSNTVPENIDMGDSVIYHYMDKAKYFSWENGGDMGDYYIEIVTVFDGSGNQNAREAGLYGGVFSGLNYLYFRSIDLAVEYINGVVNNHGEDGVIGVYMIPKVITTKKGDPVSRHTWIADVSYASNWKYAWEDKIESPKNNKLYTYPFTSIVCNNMIGSTIEYRVEDLCWEATDGKDDDGNIVWVDKEKYLDTKKEKFYYTIEGVAGAPPKCLMMPSHYGGQENARNQQLTIDNFPQCAFVTDSYRAWVAMNYRSMNAAALASGINGIGGTITSAAHGHMLSGLASNTLGTVVTIGEQLAERAKAKILPNKEHGMTAPDLAMANDSLGFRFYCAHIRPEIAHRIDEFFDRYGYQINENKIPNRDKRKHWNYVKTSDCTIVGDLPDDDKQKIITIYNRGITFWNNPQEVGDYTLDNSEGVIKEATQEPEWAEDPEFVEDMSIGESGISFHDDVVTEEDAADNAYSIYKMLKKRGWTNGAIIGLIANIDYYSHMDPSYTRDNKYGFVLWSGTRKDSLFEYLEANGYEHNDGVGQLDYIDKMSIANLEWLPTELYPIDFDVWHLTPAWGNAENSAKAFYRNYMRGTSSEREAKIVELALKWEQELKDSTSYVPDSSDEDGRDSTKPNEGTGSSSIKKSTPNPRFYPPEHYHDNNMTPDLQKKNAKAIWTILRALDWSENAIYAVLGNFEVTSNLNPWSISPDNSSYEKGDPLGLAHWRGDRLKALTNYLVKYDYIAWPSSDDIPSEWINQIPSSIRDIIHAEDWDYTVPLDYVTRNHLKWLSITDGNNPSKGQIMFLHDKGGSSREWVKTKGHNMSFENFKKSTKDVATLTEIFDYNYMRNTHSAEDTRLRKTAATKWELYFIGGRW